MNHKKAPSLSVKSLWATLKDIFALSKPYRTRFYVATATVLVGSAIWLMVPLGLRELLDAVFESGNRELLHLLSLGLFGLFIAQALFNFFGNYHLEWVGERAVTDLRKKVYEHLHRLRSLGARLDLNAEDLEELRAIYVDATDSPSTAALRRVPGVDYAGPRSDLAGRRAARLKAAENQGVTPEGMP